MAVHFSAAGDVLFTGDAVSEAASVATEQRWPPLMIRFLSCFKHGRLHGCGQAETAIVVGSVC